MGFVLRAALAFLANKLLEILYDPWFTVACIVGALVVFQCLPEPLE